LLPLLTSITKAASEILPVHQHGTSGPSPPGPAQAATCGLAQPGLWSNRPPQPASSCATASTTQPGLVDQPSHQPAGIPSWAHSPPSLLSSTPPTSLAQPRPISSCIMKMQNSRLDQKWLEVTVETQVDTLINAVRGGLKSEHHEYHSDAEFATSAVDFLHRIGRTARAGQSGRITSLYTEANRDLVSAVRQAGRIDEPLEMAFSRKRSFRNKLKKRETLTARLDSNRPAGWQPTWRHAGCHAGAPCHLPALLPMTGTLLMLPPVTATAIDQWLRQSQPPLPPPAALPGLPRGALCGTTQVATRLDGSHPAG
ncbi:hypothetical protein Taro_045425, partial [Colocasia esculenta]|nr:hypothetical protein [Colocasia esculenta]